MNMSVLVTGVSGTGKSAISGELRKMGYKAYDIENIEGLCTMVHKITGKVAEDYDKDNLESVKKCDWICDKKKLEKIIRRNPKGIVFYCGVVSNLDKLLPLFNKTFVLKASQKTLRERLSTRKSNDFGRIPAVQKWIFGWKKWWEDRMLEKGAIAINANRSLKEVAADIVNRCKGQDS